VPVRPRNYNRLHSPEIDAPEIESAIGGEANPGKKNARNWVWQIERKLIEEAGASESSSLHMRQGTWPGARSQGD